MTRSLARYAPAPTFAGAVVNRSGTDRTTASTIGVHPAFAAVYPMALGSLLMYDHGVEERPVQFKLFFDKKRACIDVLETRIAEEGTYVWCKLQTEED